MPCCQVGEEAWYVLSGPKSWFSTVMLGYQISGDVTAFKSCTCLVWVRTGPKKSWQLLSPWYYKPGSSSHLCSPWGHHGRCMQALWQTHGVMRLLLMLTHIICERGSIREWVQKAKTWPAAALARLQHEKLQVITESKECSSRPALTGDCTNKTAAPEMAEMGNIRDSKVRCSFTELLTQDSNCQGNHATKTE